MDWPLDLTLYNDIEQAVGLLEDYPFATRETLIDLVCSLGMERSEAWERVTFVPIAYLRVLLSRSGVQFSESYRRLDAGGVEQTLPFSRQRIYQRALLFAAAHLKRGMAQEKIESVIRRSGEFEEINHQLWSGAAPAAIQMAPPLIRADGVRLEPAAPASEELVSRRWWEFWK